MNDRDEIANLLERYCWTVDNRLWDEWERCFAEDGVFDVRGHRLVGRAAIRAYVEASIGDYRLVRHLLHHPSIEVFDSGQAVSRSYFELHGTTAKGRDVEALGSYQDELTRASGGWQLKLRKAWFDYFVRKGEAWNEGGDER